MAAVDAVRGELLREAFMLLVVLGGDDQPAGVLVDAMDDPRPRDAADARQLPRAMVEQRVDHRAVEIARGGMDDQIGRASGRERACPYVLILAVDVSLKKKR